MSGAPTTFPTPNGGCHPLWVLGHLALVEGMIPAALFGEPNPAADWATAISASSRNRSPIPQRIRRLRKSATMYVAAARAQPGSCWMSLSEPISTSRRWRRRRDVEREFATYGSSFLVLALHQMIHRSHVTDARRAARVTV